MLEKKVRYCKDITQAECSRSPKGRLLYRGKIYVPADSPRRLYLIQTHHEVPVAGHPGRSKTLELLSKNYHWPKMRQDVERFVRNCHTCRRSKNQSTRTLWSPPPTGDSLAAMAGHFDGLCHGPTAIKGSRCSLGGSGSAHKTAASCPMQHYCSCP